MSQILHIFKKDTRRFWPEILVSSAILFAFVWVFPERWKVHHDQSQFFRAQQFLAYLSVLWPVGWALLVARVVQAEATVGADQFWVTRPYDWKKLLVAKVLFIAVWLGGTYLLAESWLLTVAGFHPLAYIPGLLSGLLVVLVVWALPVLAVATVTSTFARLALTLVGGFVLQYAMRRVWIARAILLAVPVLMAISVIWYSRASLVDLAYSQNAVGASEWMSLSFAPTQSHPASVAYWEGEDHIYLPVHYAGVADGTAIVRDDMKFTITAADGRRWSSPWQAESEYIVPDLDGGTVQLKIRPEVYSRFKSGPVTLQVTFAVSRYQADSVTEIPYPAADAAVPGVGCSNPAHLFEPTAKGRAWTGPAGFDTRLSVVVAQNFWMDYRPTDEEQRQHLPWQICPGSPLTLTTYRSLGSGQVDLTIPNFVLPANVVATD